ncbi:MAG: cytochrome P450, partial [Proteobacteria bacterium]|nr:cytochrome P450 [Pseudomonadota bacterium]
MATAAERPDAGAAGKPAPLAPGPRYATPFPFLRRMRADSLGFLAELQREFGDVVCVRLGPLRTLLLSRPEHVHHVMVTHHRRYEKGDLFAKLKPVAGDGLLFSEGEKWRRERRWVGPVFQRSTVQNGVPTMGRLMHEVLDGWERRHAGGQTFDLMPELSRLALDMVCRALFGAEPPGASFHDRIDEG